MQRPSRNVDVSAKIEALRLRHEQCENRLRSYEKRKWLSPEEESEVRRLKRQKLQAKDEMRRFSQIGHA